MAQNLGAIFHNPVFPAYFPVFNPHFAHFAYCICKFIGTPSPKFSSLARIMAENPNQIPEIEEPSPKFQKINHNDVTGNKANEITPFLRVKKLSEKAILPPVETKVPARGKAMIPTDLSIAVPQGTYARIAPRSGLAWKHSIDVGAGVVDADYRGAVGVILFNYSDVDFEVKLGDRIAQLIIEKIVTPEVSEVDDLDSTVRGSGGFGSTGV